MILIPAGKFTVGTSEQEARRLARAHGYHPSWFDGETPEREVFLPAFLIDTFPVTNRQFARFCAETGFAPRPHWHGVDPPEHLLDHPVTNVDKADALAYCAWAGKRLPTEAEWEKAARGPEGLAYPWGNRFAASACQWNRAGEGDGPGTAPVHAHPEGASPYGVLDMIGNAAEWCADSPGPGSSFIKGGCWMTGEVVNLRAAARNMSGFANNAMPWYGFRCAMEAD